MTKKELFAFLADESDDTEVRLAEPPRIGVSGGWARFGATGTLDNGMAMHDGVCYLIIGDAIPVEPAVGRKPETGAATIRESHSSPEVPEAMTRHRMPDGTEACDPCAPIIALRVYEREMDLNCVPGDIEDRARKQSLAVLHEYFERELDPPTPENRATPDADTDFDGPFVLVNGRGLWLTVSNTWAWTFKTIETSCDNGLITRTFARREEARRAANQSPYRPVTIVPLERATPEP